MVDRIDEIDARILELLQKRGRIKRNVIAEEVGLSLPSVSERMRKLEDRDVITGYSAHLNPKRLHFDIAAFIRVRVDGSENYAVFVENACSLSEVLEVHSITGDGSHILKIRVRNTEALERLLFKIQRWAGVHGTLTSMVLSTFKESFELPVEPTQLYHQDPDPTRSAQGDIVR
ncbi:MAG: Lrp/AsnC family transcriptional regulator [Rhodothermia bacterium]